MLVEKSGGGIDHFPLEYTYWSILDYLFLHNVFAKNTCQAASKSVYLLHLPHAGGGVSSLGKGGTREIKVWGLALNGESQEG